MLNKELGIRYLAGIATACVLLVAPVALAQDLDVY